MAKKPAGEFDQYKYIEEWKSQNMKSVGAMYKKDFVIQFKDACKKLGISQSEVFKAAMIETIKKASKL